MGGGGGRVADASFNILHQCIFPQNVADFPMTVDKSADFVWCRYPCAMIAEYKCYGYEG